MEKRAGTIRIENGILVVNLVETYYKGAVYVLGEVVKRQNEIEVTYIPRNFFHISYLHGLDLSDIDPYDSDNIKKALPEYVELVEGYWKNSFFGLVHKWVPPVKRLKEGWVELEPSLPKTITATSYRIIDNICLQ